MALSPLKKVIFISLASFAITAALIFAFIVISNNVRRYHDTLEMAVTDISLGEKDFNQMKTIADLIKNRDADIQRIEHIAVDHERPLQFIETMEQIAHISSIKVALAVDETGRDPQSLVFRATLEGSRQGVRTMLALIEQLPYQINIEHISFQQNVPDTFTKSQTDSSALTHLLLVMKIKTQ